MQQHKYPSLSRVYLRVFSSKRVIFYCAQTSIVGVVCGLCWHSTLSCSQWGLCINNFWSVWTRPRQAFVMGQKTITRAVVGIPPTVGVYAKMEKRTVLLTGAAGRVGTLLRQHWGARYHLRLTDVCPISDLAEHEEYYPFDMTCPESCDRVCRDVHRSASSRRRWQRRFYRFPPSAQYRRSV